MASFHAFKVLQIKRYIWYSWHPIQIQVFSSEVQRLRWPCTNEGTKTDQYDWYFYPSPTCKFFLTKFLIFLLVRQIAFNNLTFCSITSLVNVQLKTIINNHSISLQECGLLLGFLAPFRRYIAYSILHISITEASCTPSLLLTVTKSVVYLHIINLCIFRTVVTIIIIGCQLTLLNMYVRKVTKLISKITAFTLVSYVVRFCSLAE